MTYQSLNNYQRALTYKIIRMGDEEKQAASQEEAEEVGTQEGAEEEEKEEEGTEEA